MKAGLTTTEIAEIVDREKCSVVRRAAREGWPFEEAAVRGGRQRLYPVAGLPEDIRIAHALRAAVAVPAGAPAATSRPSPHQSGAVALSALPKKQQNRADAHLAVVNAFYAFLANSSLARHPGADAFAALWNAGNYPAEDWVKASVPGFHPNSLRAWCQKVEREGVAALAGKYGRHRKGKGVIETTPELRDLIVGLLASKPHVDAAEAMRALRVRLKKTDVDVPAYRTVQRFMRAWKENNAGVFLAVTDPDAHRSARGAAFGSAGDHVVAPNQMWELDSTPTDVVLADGRRHNLVGVIDVYTRRPLVLVSPTSRTDAVLALLRKAILAWGVPTAIKTDNGKDYTSRHLERALADLGIRHVVCPPYSPEKKPHIERLLGTVSHQFMELLPGYVGHNVADRQAIRNRHSFAERREGGASGAIGLTAADLQAKLDAWLETAYGRAAHAGLDGMSPFVKASTWRGALRTVENERALDVLLAEAPDGDGVRKVGKKGIKCAGGYFIAPELGPLVGERVIVRYDAADMGRVFVFAADDGRFVCAAVDPAREGVDRQAMAIEARRRQKAALAEGKKELRAVVAAIKPGLIAEEIVADAVAAANVVVAMPRQTDVHETPALVAAGEAARHNDPAGHAADGPPAAEADEASTALAALFHLTPDEPAAPEDTGNVVRLPVAAVDADGRPLHFDDDASFGRWCVAHPDKIDEHDRRYLAELLTSWSFRRLIGIDDERAAALMAAG